MGQRGTRPGLGTARGTQPPCAGVTDTPASGGHLAPCTDQLNLAARVGVMGPFSLKGSTGQGGGASLQPALIVAGRPQLSLMSGQHS